MQALVQALALGRWEGCLQAQVQALVQALALGRWEDCLQALVHGSTESTLRMPVKLHNLAHADARKCVSRCSSTSGNLGLQVVRSPLHTVW